MNPLLRLTAVLLLAATAHVACAQQSTPKRVVIRAPQDTRASQSAVSPAPETSATDQLPPAYLDAPTRIEQVRQGRRITEVVVTPRGFSHSYRMANPDLQPLKDGPTDNGAGLSVPRFVHFSF